MRRIPNILEVDRGGQLFARRGFECLRAGSVGGARMRGIPNTLEVDRRGRAFAR